MCSVEAITSQYNLDKTPNVIANYKEVKSKVEDNSIFDKHLCAKALGSLAIMNGPTNLDDYFSAYEQIKSKFDGEKYKPPYPNDQAQHPFSFFRGTIFKDYLNPNSKKCVNKWLAEKIIDADISMDKTKLGQGLLKKLGVKDNGRISTKIESIYHTPERPDYVKAKKYKAPTKFGEITARALTRTPVLSIAAASGIGALHVTHRIKEGYDPITEIAKTSAQVAGTLTAIGYLGAIGAKHFGVLGSLAGIALGSSVPKVSEYLFQKASDIG